MKGDFSRPGSAGGYAGVLHQQGRVWLDADWNDEVLARLAQAHAENVDLFGGCAVPAPGTAFAVQPAPPGGVITDFGIGGGTGAAGRCYVDGIPCTSPGTWSYLGQPFYPDPPALPPPVAGSPLSPVSSPPAALGAMLVYLEVWQRLVTALQDPDLREAALGGPDTTARVQTIAQVKVQPLPAGLTPLTCASAAQYLPGDGAGTLSTSTATDQLAPDPCRIPDPEAYTGRENALYRVEIHDGGDVLGGATGSAFDLALAADAGAGARSLTLTGLLSADQTAALLSAGSLLVEDDGGTTERATVASVSANAAQNVTTIALARGLAAGYATVRKARAKGGAALFKWSRSNAADAFAVVGIGADLRTLTLDALGRDQAGALRRGDLIEISDDASDLGPARGHLTYVDADPDPDAFTIELADPLPAALLPGRHPVVRRWDGAGIASAAFDAASTPELDLGDGVRVTFGGSDLRPGDFWQFTARALTGWVQPLANAPPHGIRRHRAPLAVLGYRVVQVVNRITLPRLFQTAALPAAVQAGITTTLDASGVTAVSPVALRTVAAAAGATTQHLTALDTGLVGGLTTTVIALELVSDCRSVFEPLTQVDELENGVHVTGVFGLDGTNAAVALPNAGDIPVNDIFNGIVVHCDQPLDPRSVERATCGVQVELPSASVPGFGYDTVSLAADLTVAATTDGATIGWKSKLDPTGLRALVARTPKGERGLLARLVLDGNRIRSADGQFALDGNAFGFPGADGRTLLQYPSGDGHRGGDFRMWFWLTPELHLIAGSLFVSNATASTVSAFDATASGSVAPRATIGQADLLGPSGVALDHAGNLYVANTRGTLILVPVDPIPVSESVAFAQETQVAQQFNAGASKPGAATFVPRKALFRTDLSLAANEQLVTEQLAGQQFSVARPPGQTPPIIPKPLPQPRPPLRQFITYVNVFAAGAKDGDSPLYRLGGSATGITAPLGIEVDGSGQLYVVNAQPPATVAGSNGTLLRFGAGARDNTAPQAVLGGGASSVVNPKDVAVDAQGFVYVLEASQNGMVLVFAPSPATGAAMQYLLNGLNLINPFGIAVDATHVYITDRGGVSPNAAATGSPPAPAPPSIVMFPLPPQGTGGTHAVDATTVVRIGGGLSTLAQPAGITVDAAQTIYVVDGNAVKVWPTAGLKPSAPAGTAPQPLGLAPSAVISSGSLNGAAYVTFGS